MDIVDIIGYEINGVPLIFYISGTMVGLMFLYGVYCLVYNIRRTWHVLKLAVIRFLVRNKWL